MVTVDKSRSEATMHEDVEDYVDQIGEHVVQLGGVALGTARSIVQRSQLNEYPLNECSHLVGETDTLARR
jgi:DNA-binding ferritin-like protein